MTRVENYIPLAAVGTTLAFLYYLSIQDIEMPTVYIEDAANDNVDIARCQELEDRMTEIDNRLDDLEHEEFEEGGFSPHDQRWLEKRRLEEELRRLEDEHEADCLPD